mmetsp:Transcript_59078/g.157225  ORF Transcript_59078/g.157225 Transcript_59078/m.157225 type:complete len:80 (-) Transcript_59078:175-414(-)
MTSFPFQCENKPSNGGRRTGEVLLSAWASSLRALRCLASAWPCSAVLQGFPSPGLRQKSPMTDGARLTDGVPPNDNEVL